MIYVILQMMAYSKPQHYLPPFFIPAGSISAAFQLWEAIIPTSSGEENTLHRDPLSQCAHTQAKVNFTGSTRRHVNSEWTHTQKKQQIK